jgi:hypothetical protein
MFPALHILAVVLVATAMALALAHALELPGKMRLSKEQYLAIQQIYYPGFTIGGVAEPIGLLMITPACDLDAGGELGILAKNDSICRSIGIARLLLAVDAPCEQFLALKTSS